MSFQTQIIAFVLAAFMAWAGVRYIHFQYVKIQNLNIQIEEIEKAREADIEHLQREIARQKSLSDLKNRLESSNVEALIDDDSCMFNADRMRRTNEIR